MRHWGRLHAEDTVRAADAANTDAYDYEYTNADDYYYQEQGAVEESLATGRSPLTERSHQMTARSMEPVVLGWDAEAQPAPDALETLATSRLSTPHSQDEDEYDSDDGIPPPPPTDDEEGALAPALPTPANTSSLRAPSPKAKSYWDPKNEAFYMVDPETGESWWV